MDKNDHKEKFHMIGEASKLFRIEDLNNNMFKIEIIGENKFKNVWIAKLNELLTDLNEIDYYNNLHQTDS